MYVIDDGNDITMSYVTRIKADSDTNKIDLRGVNWNKGSETTKMYSFGKYASKYPMRVDIPLSDLSQIQCEAYHWNDI